MQESCWPTKTRTKSTGRHYSQGVAVTGLHPRVRLDSPRYFPDRTSRASGGVTRILTKTVPQFPRNASEPVRAMLGFKADANAR